MPMIELQSLPQILTAIGGLGTAAFGLVDATKAFWGGANRIGFSGIEATIAAFTPGVSGVQNALPRDRILCTLRANWYNGTDLASQKAIAKSLIKLFLAPENAADLARETAVDPEILTAVAAKIRSGTSLTPQPNPNDNPPLPNQGSLTPQQSDVYSRFDLILTARLDETYQQADQIYRNGTRILAVFFSIALSITAAFMLSAHHAAPDKHELGIAFLVGLLAAPLAPVAKDLSTALATAVNTLQLVRK